MTYIDEREHVFVLGSARSGTSLLSSIIKNSPRYSDYRAETLLLHDCRSKYGDLKRRSARQRFWSDWFDSRQFRRSGLSHDEVLDATHGQDSYIGVLGSYMNRVAEKQGSPLWLDGTPSNAFCLPEISRAFPNARIIHIVRDGRAVAMSLAKLGWAGVRTNSEDDALAYSALKWQAAVEAVASTSQLFDGRFMQLGYEDLVLHPGDVIERVRGFLGMDRLDTGFLDADTARQNQNERSTLHTPNSPFGDVGSGISTGALYRWKDVLTPGQVALIELHVGDTLSANGYALQSSGTPGTVATIRAGMRRLHLRLHAVLKYHTPLGRLSGTPLEVGMY